MKKLLPFFIITALVIAGCKSKAENDAIQTAKNIQPVVKENTPGSIPTKGGGYTMTADWQHLLISTYRLMQNMM